jgi:hypothetical protein
MVTSTVLKVNTRHQSRVLSVGDSIPVIGRSIGKAKDQLISTGLVVILNSSKKQPKKINLQYCDTSG